MSGWGNGGASADASLLYVTGVEDYNNTLGTLAINNGSHTTVANDGLGSFTNKTYQLPGAGDMWNVSTNRFDFVEAGLSLGDSVDIRMDMLLTAGGANREIEFGITLGEGGSPYDLTLGHYTFKSAGSYEEVAEITIYMGDTNTLNNPGSIWVQAQDNGDTYHYNGHFLRTTLMQPRVVT